MQVGFIGLGKMGQTIITHLLENGVDVVGFNRTREVTEKFKSQISNLKINEKFIDTYSIKDMVLELKSPRVIWMMVKSGGAVDETIIQLLTYLKSGDILIDGGNSFYKDSVRRHDSLIKQGIQYLDIGTSGGVEAGKNGASLMVGGDKKIYQQVAPLLKLASLPNGSLAYFGKSGAGHFVKMVHNGVEYGMMQSIAEGFALLSGNSMFKINLQKVAQNWSRGSIVRGYLMELLSRALKQDANFTKITGEAGGGETGSWTVATAKEFKIEVPIIEQSVKERQKSVMKPQFSGKVVAALREQFGGHKIKKI